MELNQITLPATDVEGSSRFYRRLGFRQIVAAYPHYARFECARGGATFSLHQTPTVSRNSGVVIYFECPDLDQQVADLVDRGFEFLQMPTDQRWLWREARLLDPEGNQICLFHAGENRRFPPWRLERQPD